MEYTIALLLRCHELFLSPLANFDLDLLSSEKKIRQVRMRYFIILVVSRCLDTFEQLRTFRLAN